MANRSGAITPYWNEAQLTRRNACPVCDAPREGVALIRRVDGLMVRRCPSCQALFVDPCPSETELFQLYGSDYFSSSGCKRIGPGVDYCSIPETEIVAGRIIGHAEIAASFDLENRAVLEVGCATGALLKSLEKYRPSRLVGVDISEFAVAEGIRRYGLDLRAGALESAGFGPSAFDLVIMVDVLEHVTQLSGFLGEAARVLKDDGAIFFCTPNADSYEAAGRRWNYLYYGLEHVLYLSAHSLAKISTSHGLTLEKTWSVGCPAVLRYKRNAPTRLGRFIAEPWNCSANLFYRIWLRRAGAMGLGLNIYGILRKRRTARLSSS
jgi:2-polyprenyl-3-methyl-5-hydroxy-6-metoxy-1,4-benzoquinol methylase